MVAIGSLLNPGTAAGTAPQLAQAVEMLPQILKLLDTLNQIASTASKFGIPPDVIGRYIASQLKIDLTSQPVAEQPVVKGLEPASPTHKAMYDELNKVSEIDLKAQIAAQAGNK